MATRSARIEQFTVDQDAPEGTLRPLLSEDHRGTYTIPFPCRYAEGEWLNTRTGDRIDAELLGWREWKASA